MSERIESMSVGFAWIVAAMIWLALLMWAAIEVHNYIAAHVTVTAGMIDGFWTVGIAVG